MRKINSGKIVGKKIKQQEKNVPGHEVGLLLYIFCL